MFWSQIFFFLFFFYIKPIGAQLGNAGPPAMPPFNPTTDPCAEAKNLTDINVQVLPKHKYAVIEQCLYYNLQHNADVEYRQSSALFLLPPGSTKKLNVTISIKDNVLQSLWMNDAMQDAHARGYFEISWKDDRLSWDTKQWKITELPIKYSGHIWVPSLSSIKQDISLNNNNDFFEFKRLKALNSGVVESLLSYNMQTQCTSRLENFPYDDYRCCFVIRPQLYADITDFELEKTDGRLDPVHYRSIGWRTRSVTLTKNYGNDGNAEIETCVETYRTSSTLNCELLLPMVLCGVLFVLSPFFGSFKTQLYVKLYVLLLQYLSLQYLSTKMAHLGSAEKTPKVFQFYELTLCVTLTSLIFTLFVWVAERQKRTLPPPQTTANFCSIVCKLFSWITGESDADGSEPATPSTKNYRADWAIVFGGIHAVISVFIVFVYCIGIIAIYS